MPPLIEPHRLRAPNELARTPAHPRRILIVGSCLAHDWRRRMAQLPHPCKGDIYLVGRALPDQPDQPVSEYDFQLVQLGLRFVLPDASFGRLPQHDLAAHEALFAHAVQTMQSMLDDAMRWNREHGILTFVVPFVTPVQNAVGRLMPRYDLRNPVYFIEKLNEAMAQRAQACANTYFFDYNEVLSSYGKMFAQDDAYSALNHGGTLLNWDFRHDQDRLEPSGKATDFFPSRVHLVFAAAWQEVVSMWRSIRQIDMVKLVVVDLDDTLWRGVTADLDSGKLPTSEGWPKGLWEALNFLKRRGILLGIISKNDEERVRSVWRQIFGRQLALDDFAIVRINWRPKPENMADILAQLNLLPRNVVYIDDNPTERAAIAAAYPDIRLLGGTPLAWRRILLWSAETQLAEITAESAARTGMVRAQVVRETQRQSMPREAFLASLEVRMQVFRIRATEDPRFARVLELINKTNQFNTTGQRWTHAQCQAALAAATEIYAFDVTDRFTEYGLVGVILVEAARITQFVMSCRVMGLGIEEAAVAQIGRMLRGRCHPAVEAVIVETERNQPCRDLYQRAGFTLEGGLWRDASPGLPAVPAHIRLDVEQAGGAGLTQAAE